MWTRVGRQFSQSEVCFRPVETASTWDGSPFPSAREFLEWRRRDGGGRLLRLPRGPGILVLVDKARINSPGGLRGYLEARNMIAVLITVQEENMKFGRRQCSSAQENRG